MPAHGDDPGRDDASGRGPAGRQDCELAGAMQQEPARRGPGGRSCDGDGYGDLEQHQAGRVVEQAFGLDQRLDPGWQGQPPPQRADRHRVRAGQHRAEHERHARRDRGHRSRHGGDRGR